MSSNYPPGVTGNEWEIAGYPPCGRNGCGHPSDEHGEVVAGDDGTTYESACLECDDCTEYTPYPERPDPDEMYDRWKDDQLMERGF